MMTCSSTGKLELIGVDAMGTLIVPSRAGSQGGYRGQSANFQFYEGNQIVTDLRSLSALNETFARLKEQLIG
jgi:hypothetical protein